MSEDWPVAPAIPPSAHVQMSRAIRTTLQLHAPTLGELSDQTLDDFTQIVCAFALDLRDEQERRRAATPGSPPPPLT